jgi:hypothetical protein
MTDQGYQILQELASALDESDWFAFFWLARRHGLGPLAFHHTGRAGIVGQMPHDVARLLRQEYCEAFVRNRRLEVETAAVVSALARRNVEIILLKGISLAARCYGDIALRPVRDIDILIQRHDLEDCAAALQEMGFAPEPHLGRRLDFDVLNSLQLSFLRPDGVHVEPHLELSRSPVYRSGLDVSALWARAERTTVAGAQSWRLALFDELRYLSEHFVIGHRARRLLWLVDISALANSVSEDEWSRFTEETIERHLARPVIAALSQAQQLLDAHVPVAPLERLRAAAESDQERLVWRLALARNANVAKLAWHASSLRDPVERRAFIAGAWKHGTHKAHKLLKSRWRRPKVGPEAGEYV